MTCTPTAFPHFVLSSANVIAPRRAKQSDGICGDSAHAARISDHNPDSRGIPHAVDISQSTPGSPDWQPGMDIFDAHAFGRQLAQAFIDGHGDQRIKYLVSDNGVGPVIFDPAVSLTWRSNPGTDHRNHLHVSFTVAAEQSTVPFWPVTNQEDEPLNAADIDAIRQIVKQTIEDAIGGSQMTPNPDPHATVLEVVKHVAGK